MLTAINIGSIIPLPIKYREINYHPSIRTPNNTALSELNLLPTNGNRMLDFRNRRRNTYGCFLFAVCTRQNCLKYLCPRLRTGIQYLIVTLRVRRFKKFLPVKTKMAFLSRILALLAILLYKQYIHHTQATLRPNRQYLSAQQYAYQSF